MNELNYETLSALLGRNNVTADAAELQGILCGMMAGGMSLSDREWQPAIADMFNAGEPMAPEVADALQTLFDKTSQQMVDGDFALTLMLPDDAAPINERGSALINYVQGFMTGFGLHQNDLTNCSADVKEALEDFAEIVKLEDAMTEDEESEKALFEVQEYIRVSTMLCFSELGHSPLDDSQAPPTVH
ncbi:UPF0149 family protein [Alteromonas facilis]|uniref:UPF0149 family protein n=1 Tax=Alteromonas facilis TaxID=2048004 RepID=UPI000C2829C1|nr:UPF0149 family protein [Alteromonas facilis]